MSAMGDAGGNVLPYASMRREEPGRQCVLIAALISGIRTKIHESR